MSILTSTHPARIREARARERNGGLPRLYQRPRTNQRSFWGELAEKELFWFEKCRTCSNGIRRSRNGSWAEDQVSYNCLDRHLATHRKNKVALLWKASRAISGRSPTRIAPAGVPLRQVLKGRGSKPATAPSSTWDGSGAAGGAAACARLGSRTAWCSADSRGSPEGAHTGPRAQVVITADGAWRAQRSAAQGRGDESLAGWPQRARRDCAETHGSALSCRRPRPLVARARRGRWRRLPGRATR